MRTRAVSLAALLCCIVRSSTSGRANTPGATQAPPQPPPAETCSAAGFRQFDFWAGEWDVADAAGKPAGHNAIAIEQQGCVLVEHWTSAAGNTGLSINYYDPLAHNWTQQWVGLGLLLKMSGGLRDGAMVLEGPLQYLSTGKVTRLRGTWSSLPDGRVRQHFEESFDDGHTWTEWFDGYYRRVAGSNSGPSMTAR
jgi:hypothetical protein